MFLPQWKLVSIFRDSEKSPHSLEFVTFTDLAQRKSGNAVYTCSTLYVRGVLSTAEKLSLRTKGLLFKLT